MTAQRPREDFWRDRHRVLVTGHTGLKAAGPTFG